MDLVTCTASKSEDFEMRLLPQVSKHPERQRPGRIELILQAVPNADVLLLQQVPHQRQVAVEREQGFRAGFTGLHVSTAV
jgi:hypothetical protein